MENEVRNKEEINEENGEKSIKKEMNEEMGKVSWEC